MRVKTVNFFLTCIFIINFANVNMQWQLAIIIIIMVYNPWSIYFWVKKIHLTCMPFILLKKITSRPSKSKYFLIWAWTERILFKKSIAEILKASHTMIMKSLLNTHSNVSKIIKILTSNTSHLSNSRIVESKHPASMHFWSCDRNVLVTGCPKRSTYSLSISSNKRKLHKPIYASASHIELQTTCQFGCQMSVPTHQQNPQWFQLVSQSLMLHCLKMCRLSVMNISYNG